ncbi:MAG: hypothetical protein HYX60_10575 [Legionella longbeachae]|nr:hypothetical protein [Legionella longbeachae]
MYTKYELNENIVKELEEEIKKNIKGKVLQDNIFIKDCAKIGAFLMDLDVVHDHLKKLNELVTERLNGEDIQTKGTVKKFRSLLEELLKEFGFQEKFAQVIGKKALTGKDFHSLLSYSLFLKDSSLRNTKHGEFGHAIQWLLIAWQQVNTNFLTMKINDIYKKLGDQDAKIEIPEHSAWFIIADEPSLDEYGCRSPEWLNEYIDSNKNDFPILQQILQKRFEKKSETHLTFKLENPPNRYERDIEIPIVLMPKN